MSEWSDGMKLRAAGIAQVGIAESKRLRDPDDYSQANYHDGRIEAFEEVLAVLARPREALGVYVAGRTGAIEQVREAQRVCVEAGYHVTFDWTGAEGEIRKDWSLKAERARELSVRELQAVRDAELLVLVWTEAGGVGNLIETGMAMATGSRVIVVGPARESVFWYLPNVERVTDNAALAEALSSTTPVEDEGCASRHRPHEPTGGAGVIRYVKRVLRFFNGEGWS